MRFKKSWVIISIILLLALGGGWLLLTNHPAVWPVRNALQYRLAMAWWSLVGLPGDGLPGTLRGMVLDEQGQPVEGAWVLLSQWDGTTYRTRSDAQGHYRLTEAPAGVYRPVVGGAGYESVTVGKIRLAAGTEAVADVSLSVEVHPTVMPGDAFSLSEPKMLNCQKPLAGEAIRRQVHFISAGQPNQPTFYYTPVTATTTSQLPLLLAVYPGPADSWECVSIPLAAAGYAVIGAGPTYSFNLEADLDELERLVQFAQAGQFPGTTGQPLGALGGSYSSLHVQRLLQRDAPIKAAVLLGAPTDLFDMRRRLEARTYIPPFGLDQAFYALGFPSREPLRYWRYSGAYHVRPDFPPLAVLHSRTDDVVPYQQSELLVEQLEAAGVPYESYFFEGGGHYLLADDGDSDALDMYEITLNFLAKYLK